MNTEQYLKEFESVTKSMLELTKAKNKDYAGEDSVDPFKNFRMVENIGICSTEQGFLTRMTDKLCRITNIIRTGKQAVKDEAVEDTLKDLAVYSILFYCFLKSKKS